MALNLESAKPHVHEVFEVFSYIYRERERLLCMIKWEKVHFVIIKLCNYIRIKFFECHISVSVLKMCGNLYKHLMGQPKPNLTLYIFIISKLDY